MNGCFLIHLLDQCFKKLPDSSSETGAVDSDLSDGSDGQVSALGLEAVPVGDVVDGVGHTIGVVRVATADDQLNVGILGRQLLDGDQRSRLLALDALLTGEAAKSNPSIIEGTVM